MTEAAAPDVVPIGQHRTPLLRRAIVAVAAIVVAAGCGDASSQRTVAAQAPLGGGAIDAVSQVAGGDLEIVGWVAADGPRSVEVRTPAGTVSVTADLRRVDLATVGTSAYGFRTVVEEPQPGSVCLVADGRELDCVRRGCADLFDSAFRAELRDAHPEPRWSVAVVDLRTGCQYGDDAYIYMSYTGWGCDMYNALEALEDSIRYQATRTSATSKSLSNDFISLS